MIYFTLPNFYFNYNINNFFYYISNQYKEWFKIPVAFSYTSGNFPYCYWNGGYNLNQGIGATYNDFINCTENTPIPLRINCSNINLGLEDFDYTMANLILKCNENGSNIIELINLELYEFIHEKYPGYNFIFSKEISSLMDINEDIINMLIDEDIFKLINLDEKKSLDIDFIKKINKKDKIELTINSICDIDCPNFQKCKKLTHKIQYDYCNDDLYKTCAKIKSYHKNQSLISIDEINKIYKPLGIKYYRISDMISDKKDSLLIFLVDYFIKDEFKKDVYKLWIERGNL